MVRKNMMAVNGVWVPDPDGLEVTYSALDKYAKLNMSAQLSRKIAGKKLKYVLNWAYMPERAEFIALWNLLADLPEYAMFTLPHPDGTMHTFQGYLGGDTTVTMMSYWDMGQGCESQWKSLKATVIER